jgi:hypothetical protein
MALRGSAAAAPDEPPSSEAARAQARALVQEGARQMDDRQYDKAVASFDEAYRLVRSPKVLFDLAIAYLSVARYADALQALQGFLDEATDAPPASQATARRHIAELRAKVVALTIKSDRPGAELTLDGRSYGAVTFDRPLTIDPGPHQLRARADDETVEQAFTAEPGQSMTVTLTFAPAATPPAATAPIEAAPPPAVLVTATPVVPRPPVYRRPWFWVAVGGAVAVAAAVILTLALSKTEYPSADARVSQ